MRNQVKLLEKTVKELNEEIDEYKIKIKYLENENAKIIRSSSNKILSNINRNIKKSPTPKTSNTKYDGKNKLKEQENKDTINQNSSKIDSFVESEQSLERDNTLMNTTAINENVSKDCRQIENQQGNYYYLNLFFLR